MVWLDEHFSPPTVWALADRQHGVVARHQLLALGLSVRGIEHRLRRGRLHPIRYRERTWRSVYAVGRPQLTEAGLFMAATLFAGPASCVSHETAAILWRIRSRERARGAPRIRLDATPIEVTVPRSGRHPRGLQVHRRDLPSEDMVVVNGIRVTSPIRTLIDLATRVEADGLEAAVNQADKLDLVDPEELRRIINSRAGLRGVQPLRKLLDSRTFVLTDSALERRFLPLVRRSQLPRPRTGAYLNGFKVDFYWPELALVVETDGLRYHRTAAQQARDRRRDQAHTAAGLTTLRFTHAQVAFEPDHVVATLAAVADRLRRP
jgi:very-short-patch-repair endonuclease